MPYLTRHWLLVLTLLCCSALVRAEDYQQLSVIPQAGPYTLGEQWQYVEDPTGRLAFSQIRQLPDAQWQWNNRPDVNFGYRQSAIWLRLTLHNPLPVARSWSWSSNHGLGRRPCPPLCRGGDRPPEVANA